MVLWGVGTMVRVEACNLLPALVRAGVAVSRLEPVRDVMGGCKGQSAVDLEVE